MSIRESIATSYEASLSRTFGDGPIREINIRLSQNMIGFLSAAVFFKMYGHLFEV